MVENLYLYAYIMIQYLKSVTGTEPNMPKQVKGMLKGVYKKASTNDIYSIDDICIAFVETTILNTNSKISSIEVVTYTIYGKVNINIIYSNGAKRTIDIIRKQGKVIINVE